MNALATTLAGSPTLVSVTAAERSISVCLPARDEASTIGAIVREVAALGIVSEIVVIDDGSTDATAEVAAASGARVVAEADVLPEAGPGAGKGNALWKGLFETRGDIVCFLDADLRNFRAAYVEKLCAPLLADDDVMLVKASYTRSFEGAPSGGGRVTELVARPLLSLLFPDLAAVEQPLGGEYAARRIALEALPFVEGWGVELALLVDLVAHFGRGALVQVDLGMREHRNRPLDELAPQARAIIATALSRAGITTREEVRERPPIVTRPEYRARFSPPR
jgi:glucosyl-3-phosphoglycerate synthase